MPFIGQEAPPGGELNEDQVGEIVAQACPEQDYRGKKTLLIVPDGTRTAPVGLMFKKIFEQIGATTRALDVMIALGTHQPMSPEALRRRLEITEEEQNTVYKDVGLFNHAWDDPDSLTNVGALDAEDIKELSGGLFEMEVPVSVNRKLFEYDQLIIVGPVFPHEVVGFSGGNKYLFPGVAGPEILNFFHWLGAVVSNPKIIGQKWTPVRKVVDKAAALVRTPKLCFALVVDGTRLRGVYCGTPETAWDAASNLSAQTHIIYKEKPFHTIVSCAPAMYEDLWTAGKAMYKLEPVLADGGELIIHAPHVREVSVTHGKVLEEIGYHCRDYFLKQWERFQHYPWGILAHSCHVHGVGRYENGVETPRARVTLASGIPPEKCRQINLGYRDPNEIVPEEFAHREEEGVLLVPKAGERLYRLKNPPEWSA